VLVMFNAFDQFETRHGHELIADTVNRQRPGTATFVERPNVGHSGNRYATIEDAYAWRDGTKAWQEAAEIMGPLDIVVSGAAGNFLAPAESLSSNAFRAVMEIDLRVPTTCSLQQITELLTQANHECEQQFPGLQIAMTQTQCYPPFALAPESDFRRSVGLLEKAGQTAERTARFATNACLYAAAGIPCIVYGPGDIAQAHTADEWIDLAQVEVAAERLEKCILGQSA